MTVHAVAPSPLDVRTLAREMRTARSLGLLVLALLIAAGCAGLGQWQFSRATQAGVVVARPTEHVTALSRIARPQVAQDAASVGQLVTVSGAFAPGDYVVIGDRLNYGRTGYWVTGHLLTTDPAAQLAVAVGWAPTRAAADAAVARLRATAGSAADLTGRYVDSDPPDDADTPDDTSSSVGARLDPLPQVLSVPQLLNLWRSGTTSPVYPGYVTLRHARGGLATIDSPAPSQQVELNLLNLFYSAEWGLFALAALGIWYRLVKDRWEQEMDAALGAGDAEPAP